MVVQVALVLRVTRTVDKHMSHTWRRPSYVSAIKEAVSQQCVWPSRRQPSTTSSRRSQ
ncbi:hypothetical protein J6590_078438, partial [Homalodisca vitripennis]